MGLMPRRRRWPSLDAWDQPHVGIKARGASGRRTTGTPSHSRTHRAARSSCVRAPNVVVPEDGITFTATYKAPDVQDVDVTLSSTQDIAGITVNLGETGADTGKFDGVVPDGRRVG